MRLIRCREIPGPHNTTNCANRGEVQIMALAKSLWAAGRSSRWVSVSLLPPMARLGLACVVPERATDRSICSRRAHDQRHRRFGTARPRRTLTVTYQGGEKTIVVPPHTPVIAFETGARATLVVAALVMLMGGRGSAV